MIPKGYWSLLLTRFSKKGILTWLAKKGKKIVVEEAIIPPISEKKKIDTVKKQRNNKHPIKQ